MWRFNFWKKILKKKYFVFYKKFNIFMELLSLSRSYIYIYIYIYIYVCVWVCVCVCVCVCEEKSPDIEVRFVK